MSDWRVLINQYLTDFETRTANTLEKITKSQPFDQRIKDHFLKVVKNRYLPQYIKKCSSVFFIMILKIKKIYTTEITYIFNFNAFCIAVAVMCVVIIWNILDWNKRWNHLKSIIHQQ